MRQRARKCREVTVIEDCYNANPDSVKAAMLTLGSRKIPDGAKKIAVLGDMLELGAVAESAHLAAGEEAAAAADVLFCDVELGRLIAKGAENAGMKNAKHFNSKDELAQELRKIARPGDIIWLKASRGMRFEDIAEAFYEEL